MHRAASRAPLQRLARLGETCLGVFLLQKFDLAFYIREGVHLRRNHRGVSSYANVVPHRAELTKWSDRLPVRSCWQNERVVSCRNDFGRPLQDLENDKRR